MEHHVYVCSWSHSATGFALWVKARPKLRGEGATYDEAEARLIRAIQDAGGAMTAVLEFDPPLPKSPLTAKYASPEILLVTADSAFQIEEPRATAAETREEMWARQRWPGEYYEGPICPKCRYAAGRRTAKPLPIAELESGYDGACGMIGYARATHQLVSEEFVELLTTEERARLELRPVIRTGRRKFFELVGPEGPPLVAVAGMKVSGWRCDACDHRTWGYWSEVLNIHDFVARSGVPLDASVFTVGTYPEIKLVVTAARWKEMVGRKGTRGFTSGLLGIAPDEEVVRRPELPTAEECLAERERHWREGLPPVR